MTLGESSKAEGLSFGNFVCLLFLLNLCCLSVSTSTQEEVKEPLKFFEFCWVDARDSLGKW
jgi:hypothetical protein